MPVSGPGNPSPGISENELIEALNAMVKRITQNADDAHADLGNRIGSIDGRLDCLDTKMDRLGMTVERIDRYVTRILKVLPGDMG